MLLVTYLCAESMRHSCPWTDRITAAGSALRKQGSLKKPPLPPGSSPKPQQRPLDVRFQEPSLEMPNALPSVFSAASSATIPRYVGSLCSHPHCQPPRASPLNIPLSIEA